MAQQDQQEGSLRLLTLGEIKLAKSVFGNSIEYHKVWIHHDSYFPLGMQGDYAALTPNGELYFRYWYRDDFSTAAANLQHLFIHEMSHVWQREKGMNVRLRGLFSWAVSYRYGLDKRTIRQYPLEQQAQIIADHFLFETFGYAQWLIYRNKGLDVVSYDGELDEAVVRERYAYTLKGFPYV
ncbi:type IV secretion protein Rhs [Cronobacter turicensis]|uniref:type IV secretion protein Rhs n=1 Tax=Enterobacteriaceae TaxID=543 RepID=UPI001375C4D0|nr:MULTISPECIES: type IV secretion protein Rhs [Enterobacteriaceae]EKM0377544.1 type IV secretion protein Rhs [Cronobacter turicensis]EKM5066928.1 type IV secretion protein Rhs [Cronobacter turicensis]EKY3196720.1 type IV secretion protein Rhs [Cronobacter turicensis]ELQ6019051.1 type IV secretion protein Rhs [Cronobacter turicensis]ELQ6077782.1 type IV secretion protein Rhs [Cronobacter turicensis]